MQILVLLSKNFLAWRISLSTIHRQITTHVNLSRVKQVAFIAFDCIMYNFLASQFDFYVTSKNRMYACTRACARVYVAADAVVTVPVSISC